MKTFLKINNWIKNYNNYNSKFEFKDDVELGKEWVMFIENQCNNCSKDILWCLELSVIKTTGEVLWRIHQNDKTKPNTIKTNYIKKFGKRTLNTLVKFFWDLSNEFMGCNQC